MIYKETNQHSTLFYLYLSIIIGTTGCKSGEPDASITQYSSISGETMGTYYNITYSHPYNFKPKIDSLLVDFNNSVSTYIPTSTISKINKADKQYCYETDKDPYFQFSFNEAKKITQQTNGAFQPTVMPLVNYWGFGYGNKHKIETPNQKKIDSLMAIVGIEKLSLNAVQGQVCITKEDAKVEIDLSGSAKGHGVDVIASFLDKNQILNYLVEIGGEIKTKGQNKRNKDWIIGISKPKKGAAFTEVEQLLKLSGKAMASSGNYRIFYESKDITYAHIIDPTTGWAKPSDLLGVTIIANTCLEADGFATACMVLGKEKAVTLMNKNPHLEAFFIFANNDQTNMEYYHTEGFKKYLIEKND